MIVTVFKMTDFPQKVKHGIEEYKSFCQSVGMLKKILYSTALGMVFFMWGILLINTLLMAVIFFMLTAVIFYVDMMVSLFFSLGFLIAGADLQYQCNHSVPAAFLEHAILVTGEIQTVTEEHHQQKHCTIVTDSIDHQPMKKNLSLGIYLKKSHFHLGEVWQLQVKLKQPRGLYNFQGANIARNALVNGIDAVGYIQDSAHNQFIKKIKDDPVIKMKKAIGIASIQPMAKKILLALLFADRSNMTQQDWQVLQNTGTSHLLAISGLHIGMLAAIGYALGYFLWRRSSTLLLFLPAQHAANFLALLFAFAYTAISGFGFSALRSLLMLIALIVFNQWLLPLKLLERLLLALSVIVIFNPLAVWSLSLQLSALAIFFIAYVLATQIQKKQKIFQMLSLWSRLQVAFMLGSMGVTLAVFQTFSLIAPLANAIAVPLVSFIILPLCLLWVLMACCHAILLSNYLLKGIGFLLVVSWKGLVFLQSFAFSSLHIGLYHGFLIFFPLLTVLLLLAPAGLVGRSLAPLLLLPVLVVAVPRPKAGDFSLTVLDVGQGLAAVIQTAHHLLIYDTGPRFMGGFDAGQQVVYPYLLHQGSLRVDSLVISHGDNDHIGGASFLLKQLNIPEVLTSIPKKLVISYAEFCHIGQFWRWDGVDFQVLFPLANQPYQGNNSSCVLKVTDKNKSLLLVGDIEAPAEMALLSAGKKTLMSDILVAPHHGSRTSSSVDFVAAVAPRVVIFPTGFHNRYGFPAKSVKLRYQKAGALLLETAQGGSVEILD